MLNELLPSSTCDGTRLRSTGTFSYFFFCSSVLEPTASAIITVVIALAVGSSTLEQKKKYENVPVLRNLVPSQVLLGNSSFNVGNSISAGLPSYVRNRIKAIAGILDRG